MDYNKICEISESITEAQCAIEQGQTIMEALTQIAYEYEPEAVIVSDDPLEVQGVSGEAEQYARNYKMTKGLFCLVNKSIYECDKALDGLGERLDSIGRDESGEYFCTIDPLELDGVFEEPLADFGLNVATNERIAAKNYPVTLDDGQLRLVMAINALGIPSSKREAFNALIHAISGYATVCEETAYITGAVDQKERGVIVDSKTITEAEYRDAMEATEREAAEQGGPNG